MEKKILKKIVVVIIIDMPLWFCFFFVVVVVKTKPRKENGRKENLTLDKQDFSSIHSFSVISNQSFFLFFFDIQLDSAKSQKQIHFFHVIKNSASFSCVSTKEENNDDNKPNQKFISIKKISFQSFIIAFLLEKESKKKVSEKFFPLDISQPPPKTKRKSKPKRVKMSEIQKRNLSKNFLFQTKNITTTTTFIIIIT